MSRLQGKRVFVTGGTGFLGTALLPRLHAEGAAVVALARSAHKADRLREAGFAVAEGDLTELDRLRHGMRDCDLVIHSAAALDGSYAQMFPATVTGTRNIMTAAADMGVRRVVHVSSVAVYGLAGRRAEYAEDAPLAPSAYPYITTKQMAEAAVRAAGAGGAVEWTIMRPGLIYGPRAGLWTRDFFRLARRRPAVFVGQGAGTAPAIFVDDVTEMIVRLAAAPAAAAEIFNCVMDAAPSFREFIGAYQHLAGADGWLGIPEPLAFALAGVTALLAPRQTFARDLPDALDWMRSRRRYPMDKARRLLGWEPQVTLADGVARCAPWLREEGLLVPRA